LSRKGVLSLSFSPLILFLSLSLSPSLYLPSFYPSLSNIPPSRTGKKERNGAGGDEGIGNDDEESMMMVRRSGSVVGEQNEGMAGMIKDANWVRS